jgi:hypothetical protein
MDLSYIPDSTVKHTDWEVAAVTRITIADGAAGCAALFSFRNGSYSTDPVWSGLEYDMAALGGGFGVGVGMRDLIKQNPSLKMRPSGLNKKWHKIECDQAFSASDLSGSSGRISSLMLVVYEVVLISAGNLSGSLFGGQSVSGLGLGAGGAITLGFWQYVF